MTRWLLVLALACGFLPAAAPAQDAPALWSVRAAGKPGKVTLFGSFHLLPEDVRWRTDALDAALKEAAVIVFETDLAEAQDPAVMQPLMARHGLLPPGQTLASRLPADTWRELEKLSAALGVPAQNLAPLRPWLAGLVLSLQFMREKGFDPARGVEQQVTAWARSQGRSISALETTEEQLSIFAGLSREEEAAMLAVSLRQIRETPRILADMLSAYRRGDVAALDRVLNTSLDELPSLRRRLLRERHERWLPQIDSMLASNRATVVIVGAAHLVGPDSVPAMLRARGLDVTGP